MRLCTYIEGVPDEEIATSGALRGRLLELHEAFAEEPTVVFLEASDGSCLHVGLGHEVVFLNYVAPGGWPACTSVGDEAAKGLLLYRCGGEITEGPASNGIPLSDAVGAAIHYFDAQEPSPDLTWEDD